MSATTTLFSSEGPARAAGLGWRRKSPPLPRDRGSHRPRRGMHSLGRAGAGRARRLRATCQHGWCGGLPRSVSRDNVIRADNWAASSSSSEEVSPLRLAMR